MSEDKLTTEQRQELYTLMGQWSRNTDLQFQQVAEWADKQLAQVCEQRGKSCCGDAHGQLSAMRDHFRALGITEAKWRENGVWQIRLINERAEAAELALRSEKIAHADTHVRLQAKEQTVLTAIATIETLQSELAQLTNERKLMRDLFWPSANEKEAHIYEIRNGHTKEFVEAHVAELVESELAQSRQQAIADAREEICELAETAAIGNSEPSRSTLLKLVQVIRSLTPPPALTVAKEAK